MSRLPLTFLILSLSTLPVTAFAEADCNDAKDLTGVVESFYGAEPELKNIITPTFSMRLKGMDGHPDPSGIRYMHEGESIDLDISEDGELLNLEKALAFNKDGKICKLVNGELVDDVEGDTVTADMNFAFPYANLDGEHSLDELTEGAKDGSKVMKSLAPGGLGFVVPGLKSIMLKPAEKDGAIPELTFLRNGQPVEGPEISAINKTQLFKLKELKKSKADTVRVTGAYKLEATFKYDKEDIEKARAAQMADAKAAAANTATE